MSVKHTADNWDFQLDADLLTLDLKNESIGTVPEDIIETLMLKTPGDFSISQDGNWKIFLKGDNGKMHCMIVEKRQNGKIGVRGMLHGEGSTLLELIYDLRDPTLNYLSATLGAFPRNLVKRKDLEDLKLISHKKLLTWDPMHSGKDDDYMYARATILVGETQLPVILKRHSNMDAAEWNKLLYEDFRVSLICIHQKLPVFYAIGAVIEPPTLLIYPVTNGVRMPEFLAEHLAPMGIGSRIEMCRAVCSVMSELYAVEVYHGAPATKNFYVKFRKQINPNDIRILFNGTIGLVPKSEHKKCDGYDLTQLAPECSLTRILSPQSGVYSLGKVFMELMKGCEEKHNDENFHLLGELNRLVCGCLNSRPHQRPTMNGIYPNLKKICEIRNKSSDEKWKIY